MGTDCAFGPVDFCGDASVKDDYEVKEMNEKFLNNEVEQRNVETRMEDDVKKTIAAVVIEQRKCATSADIAAGAQPNSTRVSPSLSSMQELSKDSNKYAKLVSAPVRGVKAGIPKGPINTQKHVASNTAINTNANKLIGGFYVVKDRVVVDVTARVATKSMPNDDEADAEGPETLTATSDDNDSESTTGVVVSQFAFINQYGDAARNSEDIHSNSGESESNSHASDRTCAEPYLTSMHSSGLINNPYSAFIHKERHVAISQPFSSLSQGLVVEEESDEGAEAGIDALNTTAETCDAAVVDTSLISMSILNISNTAAINDEGKPSSSTDLSSAPGRAGTGRGDEPTSVEGIRVVNVNDDLNTLDDDFLLQLSSLREKICDEADRILLHREMHRKLQSIPNVGGLTAPSSNLPIMANKLASGRITPTSQIPVVGKRGVTNIGKKGPSHPRSAWEEPPAVRQHGSQLKNEKMFQSVLAEAGLEGTNAASMLSTSPGVNRFGPANFSSRPNSRGATDSKNATIKNAITQIIRTNAQYDRSFADLAVGRCARSVASRNTLRNTHITPQIDLRSGVAGLSPLEATLAEARRLSSPLKVSPRTAFDDRSASSSDDRSCCSSASGALLHSRTRDLRTGALSLPVPITSPQPSRKSALSMAMDAIAPISETQVTGTESVPTEASMKTVANVVNNVEAVNPTTNIQVPIETEMATESSNQMQSNPIAILAHAGVMEPLVMRQQSGSAPAQISIGNDYLSSSRTNSKEWMEEEEDELKGLF